MSRILGAGVIRAYFRTRCPTKVSKVGIASRNMSEASAPVAINTAPVAINTAPVGIDTAPAEGQLIEHEGVSYNTIREGLAHILVPPNARTATDPKLANKVDGGVDHVQSVFYNPIQQFNRDLSVLAIKAFGEHVMARREQRKLQTRARKDKKRQTATRDGDGESKRRKGNAGQAIAVDENHTDCQPKSSENDTEHTKTAEIDKEAKADSTSCNTEPDKMDVDDKPKHEPANTDKATDPHKPNHLNHNHATNNPPPKFRILDALSATGLRALRYASEIPFATSVVSNDMSEAAVASIALNVRHNKLTSKITPSTGNAIGHMYQAAFATPGSSTEAWAQGKYDVVDLDPYGTAVPFLDAAIQSLNDGGLLCVTCTDAGVFASCGYVEKAFSLYGGLPVKGPHSHEAGLRLILHSIATAAGKYGIAIEPLLSLSIDYYARVFVRIKRSPADVKFLAGKTMLVHSCDAGCGAWQIQHLARHTAQKGRDNFKHGAGQSSSDKYCPHCGFKTHVAGPMWGGPIHNPVFIQRILDVLPKVDRDVYHTTQRIEGMLTSALDEMEVLPATALPSVAEDGSTDAPIIPSMPSHALDPHPFFFMPSNLARILHCQAPSEAAIKGALRKAGFVATRSHCKPGTIKTEASWDMIWEVLREWVRQKAPIREGKVVEKMAGFKILQHMRKGPDVEEEAPKVTEGLLEAATEGGEEKAKELTEAVTNNGEEEAAVASNRAKHTGPPQAEDVKKFKIVFDEKLGKDPMRKKLMRYQQNPRENWGPMARARITGGGH